MTLHFPSSTISTVIDILLIIDMDKCYKKNSKDDIKIEKSVDLLKAISEPNRIRILYTLSKDKICVCELADRIGIPQNLMSFHLKTLHNVGILEKIREGNNIYYVIRDNWRNKIENIFQFLDIK